MEGCILEDNFEGQRWQTTLFINLSVVTWVVKIFLKRGNIRKRVRLNRRLRLLCTLCIGSSRKFNLHFTFNVLAKILKWWKVYTKTDSLFQKSYEKFGQIQTSNRKSKELKFDELLLSKKYILSAKKLYTEDLSIITFNYLCKNSPNSWCHFWNHKSFFTTQFLCIFLA